jgi:predicted ester cyclase
MECDSNTTTTTAVRTTAQTIAAVHAALESDGLCGQLPYYAQRSRNHGFEVSRDELRAVLEDIEAAFPDVTMEVLDLAVEGDVAIGRYAMSGTHLGVQQLPYVHGGVLFGLPPTGRRFRTEHAHVFRVRNGEIVAHDAVQDNLELARQLGVLPAPHTGSAADPAP